MVQNSLMPSVKTFMMKKLLFLSAISLFTVSFAQIGTSFPSAKTSNEETKWTFGGYAGLGGAFGTGGGIALYVAPRVGYKVAENFEVGMATNLNWQNSKYYSSSTLGVGPFANYYFGRSFYISGMFQEYFYSQKDKVNGLKYNGNEAALYLGGGYMQRLGDKVYMQIGGMYNVLYKKDQSIFGGGFIPNVGIVYGL